MHVVDVVAYSLLRRFNTHKSVDSHAKIYATGIAAFAIYPCRSLVQQDAQFLSA